MNTKTGQKDDDAPGRQPKLPASAGLTEDAACWYPGGACRPRPPPFDPRRFRLETWLGAAILARGEAAEAPVRGSRSGAARAPLPWAAARAPAEPERGAPHLRPHHGKRRAGSSRRPGPDRGSRARIPAGGAAGARRGLRGNPGELPRPPGLRRQRRRGRPALAPPRPGRGVVAWAFRPPVLPAPCELRLRKAGPGGSFSPPPVTTASLSAFFFF